MTDSAFAAGIIGAFILLVVVAIFAISGFVFALSWNFVAPLFWHGAPHLTWLHGVAAGFVVGILRGIFTFNNTQKSS